ncbi:hypothetical protein AAFF_G00103100 [Aldrovandia affinis]|uniref:Uncharacterized protein n=1 Tax=Aldrovandia affinis TaxID=143900 RepID=A0AAD7RUQ5_9TELE|nr:hypothetical protein AAFF_G00103100 [Aldrovandia affinis]
MGNVRSLANKMDELTALARSQAEFRECSIMCFTESWLHKDIPDNNVSVDGFQTVRGDRDCIESVNTPTPSDEATPPQWLPDWRRHPSPTHDGLHSCSGEKPAEASPHK